MSRTPDNTCQVVQRAEVFITTAFPGIDKGGPQWNDLVMTFVAGAMETATLCEDPEALAEHVKDIMRASEAYL